MAQASGTVELWLALFVIACILLVVFTVLLLFFAKRLRIATRIIGEASKAIGKIMSSLFFPLFTGVMYMAVTAYFALTSAYIATSAEAKFHLENRTSEGNLFKNSQSLLIFSQQFRPFHSLRYSRVEQ